VLALGVLGAVLAGSLAVASLSGDLGRTAPWDVVWDLRLRRALFAAVVGGCLGTAGAAFQALLRNPLASPYILGVSGGGSLGAVAAILLGLPALAPGWPTLPLFAFAGCLGAIGIIHLAASRRGHLRAHELLLAGVVANSFFLALMAILQYLADPTQSAQIMQWTLGAVHDGRVPLPVAAFLALAGLVSLGAQARSLNLLSVGDETAALLGVDVSVARRRAFLAASLLTATAVSVSGPVGFLGLFMPHAVRHFLGPDHRLLLPASFLGGAAFLVLADTAARAAFSPYELPVGVITAVLGAPAFIVLLGRGGRAAAAQEENP
jgi:iron complex transport system permease protein